MNTSDNSDIYYGNGQQTTTATTIGGHVVVITYTVFTPDPKLELIGEGSKIRQAAAVGLHQFVNSGKCAKIYKQLNNPFKDE